MKKIGLSVIIPVYNAADWIGPTLQHLDKALRRANFDAEIIVVDDGSSDGSADAAAKTKISAGARLEVVSQKNKGRYLARKKGVLSSRTDNILFIDSRTYVGLNSLRYLYEKIENNQDQIWNGHIIIDKAGNPYTRFWDAIAFIGWRKYFRHPTETEYGIKDFDHYPKGTTFLYLPKRKLIAAMRNFEETTIDIEHSSDDTLLLRFMNERQNIHLSPQFSALYHGRTNLKSFFKHAYHRGEFFIDGFLRPGTRFFIPLLGVLAASIVAIAMLAVFTAQTVIALLAIALLFAAGLLIGALLLGVEWRDAASLAGLGVPFSVVYLLGLWRGVLRKLV